MFLVQPLDHHHGEKSNRETAEQSIPFLRRKMFPKTSGRSEGQDSEEAQAFYYSIYDTRCHFLVAKLRHAVDSYGCSDIRCANITAALGDFYEMACSKASSRRRFLRPLRHSLRKHYSCAWGLLRREPRIKAGSQAPQRCYLRMQHQALRRSSNYT